MSEPHPLRTAADTADSNVTSGGITETMLGAEMVHTVLALGATDTLNNRDFSVGGVPLAIAYGKTGFLYFLDSDDHTTEADEEAFTVIVSADGKRYKMSDMSAVAISSVLAIQNDPPVMGLTFGDRYIVDVSPTGAWSAYAKHVALYTARGWVFIGPKVGQALLNEDTGLNVQYDAAGDWGSMATALDVEAVHPGLMQFPSLVSVEAQQNAPPVSITIGLHYLVGSAGSGAWSGHSNDVAYSLDGATWGYIDAYAGFTVFNKSSNSFLTWFETEGAWRAPWPYESTFQFRLSLESGVAISTSDQANKATLFLVPFNGNNMALYVNGGWALRKSAEISLSLSGYTTARCYDIFVYDNNGTPTLESLIWTNATTRATGITTQDGIYVKSGDPTRRYVGTIYTSATGQCTDSLGFRYVWNLYNRVARPMLITPTGNTWTQGLAPSFATYRQVNGSTANQLDFVNGLDLSPVSATHIGICHAGGATSPLAAVAIGLGSTTSPAAGCITSAIEDPGTSSGKKITLVSTFEGHCGIGKRDLRMLEYGVTGSGGTASGSITFIGDNGDNFEQSGMRGTVWC